MFILLSLLTALAHARLPSCEEDFATDRTEVYTLIKGGRTSHVLSLGTDERALNEAARAALDQADRLVFEAGAAAKPDPRTPGLVHRISAPAWILLIDRLTAKGVPLAEINGFSPALAYHLLEVTPAQLTHADVFRQIYRAAKERGAQIEALESAERQNALSELLLTADELQEALLIGAAPPRLSQLRDREPKRYRALVTERHEAWIDRIRDLHRRRGRTVFVLGGLHLGGAEGVLAKLSADGFGVRRVN